MFDWIRRRRASKLDAPIGMVLNHMAHVGPESPEFAEQVKHLDRLMEMKTDDRRHRISPDTVLIVLGNLLGILVIVAYEQKHVLTSRALMFVNRTEPKIHN